MAYATAALMTDSANNLAHRGGNAVNETDGFTAVGTTVTWGVLVPFVPASRIELAAAGTAALRWTG
ncbi:hypothetical protein [Streptomyces lydicus]|uniref:hypothetical protein n=1 Tax=Streptomyces lydicus TaxID=47763 RepID=UPI0037AB8984